MPSPEMWHSLEKIITTFASVGINMTPSNLSMMAGMFTSGAGSSVTTLRTGQAQADAVQAWSDQAKNMLGGTGLMFTSMLTEAKRLEGTTDLSAKQWQDLLKREGGTDNLSAEDIKNIEATRKAWPGAMGTAINERMLAAKGYMTTPVMENLYFNATGMQLKNMDPRARAAFSAYLNPAAGSEDWEWNRITGTPTSPSAGFTVMTAHGKRGPFSTKDPDAMSLKTGIPTELSIGPTGEVRAVDASATAAKLAVANLELDTLGKVTDHLNQSFSDLFSKIDKWVGGGGTGRSPGPSA